MSVESELATLEARVDNMEKRLDEIASDVKAVRSRTDKWSGVTGLIMLAIPTTFGAVLGWIAHKFGN